jgi:hypothetical protein
MLTIVKPEETKSKFLCEYCKKEFAKETSIAAHMCEPKRRYASRDEAGDRLGFQSYIRFYETAAGSARNKTFDTFAESAYYRAFVKFGRYCVGIRAINPPRFIDWLLKNNKKIDYWCSDRVYTEYLISYLQVEAVDDALSRAVEFGLDWAEDNSAQPNDCLRYGNANAMCYAVTTGRISPWVIYNSESGQKFLSSLDPTQIAMIWPYIDSDIWQQQFAKRAADQAYAQEILTRAGW